jgi:hypothetical protein
MRRPTKRELMAIQAWLEKTPNVPCWEMHLVLSRLWEIGQTVDFDDLTLEFFNEVTGRL